MQELEACVAKYHPIDCARAIHKTHYAAMEALLCFLVEEYGHEAVQYALENIDENGRVIDPSRPTTVK